MKRLVIAVVIAGVLVGGCGGDSPDVSHSASAELRPRVAEIRQLAGQRQADQVAAKLAELRPRVSDLVQRGELSERGAQGILAAIDGVQGQLALITTTTTTPPPPPPPPRNDDEGHGEDDEDEDEHRDEERRDKMEEKRDEPDEEEDD